MTTAEAQYMPSTHDWAASLDSLEGVPDIFEPRPHPKPHTIGYGVYDFLNWLGTMLPGICMALALAWVGSLLADFIGRRMHGVSPVSPVTLAVALGLLVRNTVGVPKAYEPGLRFCLRTVLRIGIVILGLTLSIVTVGVDVAKSLPIIIGCMTVAMVSVSLITRALKLPRKLGTLIAVGTSICGVSAIIATAPVIEADENETSYAAACVTIFGMLAMITYPFIAHNIFTMPTQAGMFLGTSIHDMSQATGAGLAYAQQYNSETAFHTAVSVKLVRNLFMSILIPLAGVLYHRGSQGTRRVQQKWHQIVPFFVVGFLLMACIRSLGDFTAKPLAFGLIDHAHWTLVGDTAKWIVLWLLAMAMAAVGLGTGLSKLRGLGWKPFVVGFAAALLVGCVSITLIKVLTPFLHLRPG